MGRETCVSHKLCGRDDEHYSITCPAVLALRDEHMVTAGGLCGDEKRSADKLVCTPLSKQRKKHIQRVLVEATKLAPRRSPDLALVYENAKKEVNANCPTLAVVRKLVAYPMAVGREQQVLEPMREFTMTAA
jgi:transposase